MDQTLMQKYADFIVRVGVNVRPSQTFIIHCPVEAAFFARACAKAGFEAGAADVVVKYGDEQLARIRMELGDEAALSDVKPHLLRSYLDYAESEGGVCTPEHPRRRPGGVQGTGRGQAEPGEPGPPGCAGALARLYHERPGTVVRGGDPHPAWAHTVFPELPEAEAVETLWKLILRCAG